MIKLINLNEEEQVHIDKTKLNICLIGFCCDEGIARNLGRTGAKEGPDHIRKEFANLPVSYPYDICLYDAGNIVCEGTNLEYFQAELSKAVSIILNKNMFPVVLGGGHEIALGHFFGISDFLKTQNPKSSAGIINFDAHFDLRPYKNKGSSGTMFSQIADHCSEKDKPFNYMCIGIQTSANTNSLFKKADKLGVKYILAKDLKEDDFNSIEKKIDKYINDLEHIYVTICSDVFNSAFAPAVSSTQPFGIDPEIVLHFLKRIIASGKVISFDIAEVSPRFDHDRRTAKLAAVLIFAVINTLIENKKA